MDEKEYLQTLGEQIEIRMRGQVSLQKFRIILKNRHRITVPPV